LKKFKLIGKRKISGRGDIYIIECLESKVFNVEDILGQDISIKIDDDLYVERVKMLEYSDTNISMSKGKTLGIKIY